MIRFDLEKLPIVPSSIYPKEDKYVEIRQITGWMQMRGQRGDWFKLYDGYSCEYDICYTERQPYGNTYELVQNHIDFDELPQSIIDYLYAHNYKHYSK